MHILQRRGNELQDLGIVNKNELYRQVQELPNKGSSGVVYLVADSSLGNNAYQKYIWSNNAYISLGATTINLDPYTTDVNFVKAIETLESLNSSLLKVLTFLIGYYKISEKNTSSEGE